MSKGNMFLGYAKGKVGSVVFSRLRGNQVTRAYNATPANPKTESQENQRTQLANIVNFYRRGRTLLNHSFTNKKENQSSYNAFVSHNLTKYPVYLSTEQANGGASIVAPYLISDGVLEPIQISGSGVDAVTNIAVGGLTITETTTVGQVSTAILNNNARFQEGDQLTYVSAIQHSGINGGQPFAQLSYIEMDIDTNSAEIFRNLMPAHAFEVRGGFVGHGPYVASGGFAWIQSRKNANGSLQASRQNLILTSDALYNQFASEEQRIVATRSYGAQRDSLLTPDGSGTSGAVAELPSIASVEFDANITLINGQNPNANIDEGAEILIKVHGSNFDIADDDEEAVTTTLNGTSLEVDRWVGYLEENLIEYVVIAPADIKQGDSMTLAIRIKNRDGKSAYYNFSYKAPSTGGEENNPL